MHWKIQQRILPLNPKFEYGILPLIGNIEIANETVDIDTLLYLPCGQSSMPVRVQKGSKSINYWR